MIEQWTASGVSILIQLVFSWIRYEGQFLSDLLSPTGRDIYKVSGGLSFEAGLFNGDVSLNEMLIEPTSQKIGLFLAGMHRPVRYQIWRSFCLWFYCY